MTDPKYFKEDLYSCLSHVVEECGEVLAAAGKTQRWGFLSSNPELPEAERETNVDWLMREIDDLKGAIGRLETAATRDLDWGRSDAD